MNYTFFYTCFFFPNAKLMSTSVDSNSSTSRWDSLCKAWEPVSWLFCVNKMYRNGDLRYFFFNHYIMYVSACPSYTIRLFILIWFTVCFVFYKYFTLCSFENKDIAWLALMNPSLTFYCICVTSVCLRDPNLPFLQNLSVKWGTTLKPGTSGSTGEVLCFVLFFFAVSQHCI